MSNIGNYHNKEFEEQCKQGNFSRFKRFWAKIYKNIIPALKRLSMGLFLALTVISCKPEQIIVEKDKLVYVTKDSIVHRDSTIYVPVEVYKDYAMDTLVLRTSLAESKSWLDTSNAYLVGEIRNLKALEVKYIEVDKWHTKDSLVYKEKPVPYPVIEEKIKRPWWAWICLTWTIISIASIGWSIYRRLRP